MTKPTKNCGLIFRLCFMAVALPMVCLGQSPQITGLAPEQGVVGEKLTITGSNFPASNSLKVFIANTEAEVLSSTSTQININVPAGGTRGAVTVTDLSKNLTAYAPQASAPLFKGLGFDASKMVNRNLGAGQLGLWQSLMADFNGDGKLDVAHSATASNAINIYKNTATTAAPSFQVQTLAVNIPSRALAAGDLNGDGRPELIIGGHATKGNTLHIYPNLSSSGIISWGTPVVLTLPTSGATRIMVYDLNADGKPEITVTDQTVSKAYVFQNNGTGNGIAYNSSPLAISFPSSNLFALDIADVDGDKKPDIVSSNYLIGSIYCSRNTSNGSLGFATPETIVSGITGAVEVKLGDLNGDKSPDVAWADNVSGQVGYSFNQSSSGNLQFNTPQLIPVLAGPWDVALADLNGDAALDIICHHTTGTKQTILLNNGNGSSFITYELPIGGGGNSVQVGDINGDARPDILYTNAGTSNTLQLVMNQQCFAPTIREACASGGVLLLTDYSPFANYHWSLNGTPISGATNYELLATTTGNYSVSLTAWGGCSSAVSYTLNSASGMPGNPKFATVAEVCEGQELVLTVEPAVAGASYLWQGPNGLSASTSTNSYKIANASPADAVLYQVTITTNDCEATLAAPSVAIINALPSAEITKISSGACAGDPVTLEATSATATTYQWKLDGQDISGAQSKTVSVTTGGNYTVEVTNSKGCSKLSNPFNYAPSTALAPNFQVAAVTCKDLPVQFANQTSQPAGETLYYRWNFGDGSPISTEKNPVHTYTSTAGSPYTVRLQVGYGPTLSCAKISTQTIQVVTAPTVSVEAESLAFCQGEETQLTLVSNQNISEVRWSDGQQGATIKVNGGGTYSAEVLTEAGCTVVSEISLTAWPIPEVKVSADKLLLSPGESATLLVEGGSTYNWSPAAYLDNPLAANPVASPVQTTEFTVTATSDNGCIATSSITIEVETDFEVHAPKLFLPEVDTYWQVEGIQYYPNISLTLVNSLGQAVLEALPYTNNWDGTKNGTILPTGAYYYVFKDASGKVLKSGSISLVR